MIPAIRKPVVPKNFFKNAFPFFSKMSFVEILTRNIQVLRRQYGLVVKIFVFGYKGCGFESPHVHFHTGDPQLATRNQPQLTLISKDFPHASHALTSHML